MSRKKFSSFKILIPKKSSKPSSLLALKNLIDSFTSKGALYGEIHFTGQNRLVCENGYWKVEFKGKTATIKNRTGIKTLAYLLQSQTNFKAFQLAQIEDPGQPEFNRDHIAYDEVNISNSPKSFAMDQIDEMTVNQVKKGIQNLKKKLKNDPRNEETKNEISQLELYLREGTSGSKLSPEEKALWNRVYKRLKDTFKEIKKVLPDLYLHLKKHISTNGGFMYRPPEKEDWIIKYD